MLVIRPITLDDLDPLLELAGQAGFGLTTLPKDRELLRTRILDSEQSFERMSRKPRGEVYLVVLEDLRTGRPVGTAGIVSKVGGFEPFYAYRVKTQVFESDVLGVRKEVPYLELVIDHNGPCELGSLFLAPEYRKDGNGRLLSLSRFLLMAEHPERFDPVVIAEMRGIIDEQGHSPFWDALGRHFFDIDFPNADYLSMVNKKFIADLMPRFPIYIPLLPKEAQAVIAQVHPQTAPAMRILQEEGFTYCDMVDIFDAGPTVSCKRDDIRTIRASRRGIVGDITDAAINSAPSIIAAARPDFRAAKGPLEELPDGSVRLPAALALALQLKVGDPIRHAPLRPASSA